MWSRSFHARLRASRRKDLFQVIRPVNPSRLISLLPVDTRAKRVPEKVVLGEQIAQGNNGTVVFKGTYEEASVAVKRLVKGLHDDSLEIEVLIQVQNHANVIPLYGKEEDENFIYLAMEHCDFSLSDLVKTKKHKELWSCSTGFPTNELLMLMRGIVAGLVHLHSLGLVHMNLKPSNVLIAGLCPKLSGFASCRSFSEEVEIFDNEGLREMPFADIEMLPYDWRLNIPKIGLLAIGTSDWEMREHLCWGFLNFFNLGYGGWRALEFLEHGIQTPAVDVFALGCVLFFCLTQGTHPFGGLDINVIRNEDEIFSSKILVPEAKNLLPQLLHPDYEKRPKASMVLRHPLFWLPEKRLSFLSEAGNWVETQHKKAHSVFRASQGSGFFPRWDKAISFFSLVAEHKKYKVNRVGDLLRFINHTRIQYKELSRHVQEVLGEMPEGVDLYFRKCFPHLLMYVYESCKQEEWFMRVVNDGL